MKFLVLAAAGMVAALTVAPAAEAQTTRTTTVRHDGGTTTRTTVTRHRGPAWGHNRWRWRTTCRTAWRHGHKYRTCRRVRVRY